MHFDIDKFLEELAQQNLTNQQAGMVVYQEIRKAENQKVGFLDQSTENPAFYTLLASEVDSYITRLKGMHNELAPKPQELDQELYQQEQPAIDLTLKIIEEIEQLTSK